VLHLAWDTIPVSRDIKQLRRPRYHGCKDVDSLTVTNYQEGETMNADQTRITSDEPAFMG
jgi:hypothetical protein